MTDADKWADLYRAMAVLNGGRIDAGATLTGFVEFALDALNDTEDRKDACRDLIALLRRLADKINTNAK